MVVRTLCRGCIGPYREAAADVRGLAVGLRQVQEHPLVQAAVVVVLLVAARVLGVEVVAVLQHLRFTVEQKYSQWGKRCVIHWPPMAHHCFGLGKRCT